MLLFDSGSPEEVRVVRSSRSRRPTIRIADDGVAVLQLPENYPARYIDRLIADNQEVIASLREKHRRLTAQADPLPEFRAGAQFRFLGDFYPLSVGHPTGFDGEKFVVSRDNPAVIRRELHSIYRKLAGEVLEYKVRKIAARHGIELRSIKINSASGRWGSCSSEGNLNFSWKLVMVPEALLEYVAAHELAHRRQMNHSPAFWLEVGKLCPNYRVWRKLLRQEEHLLRWDF